jgi:hypothetical protein
MSVRKSHIYKFVVITSKQPFKIDNLTRKLGIQALCSTSCGRASLLTRFDVHLHKLEQVSNIKAPNVLGVDSTFHKRSARLNDIQHNV